MRPVTKARQADVVDWNWKIEGGKLVLFPSVMTFFRYSLYLLLVPGIVLASMSFANATPWYFWNVPSASKSDANINEVNRDGSVQRDREKLREIFGESLDHESIERALENIEHKRIEREKETRARSVRTQVFGRVFAIVLGGIWLMFSAIALLLIIILARLPFARYEIFRERDGHVRIVIPELFWTSTIRLPMHEILAVSPGFIDYRSGRFGIPIRVWFVSIHQPPGAGCSLKICIHQENGHRNPPIVPSRAEQFIANFAGFLGIHVLEFPHG